LVYEIKLARLLDEIELAMGLRVVNETSYLTEDLRTLIRACLRHCGASSEREVAVVYSRRPGCSGTGQYPFGGEEGWQIRLRLPRPRYLDAERGRDERWLLLSAARVLEHEVGHTLGLNHREMRRDLRKVVQDVPWADGLRIRLRGNETAPAAPPATNTRRGGRRRGVGRPRLGVGPTAQIAVRIPEELLSKLDRLVQSRGFRGRSDAIRQLIEEATRGLAV
jgi:hypothetical protein